MSSDRDRIAENLLSSIDARNASIAAFKAHELADAHIKESKNRNIQDKINQLRQTVKE